MAHFGSFIRGHVHMTSALRGERLNSDQRKGVCVDLVRARGKEGVKFPENFADVICTSPLNPQNGASR